MLTNIRNQVRYSPGLSQEIGVRAGQQRHAYNAAVDLILKSPNLSKHQTQAQLTLLRQKNPQEWPGTTAVQRPGLFRGRNAVRQFDGASKNTLRETAKEVKLRAKPPAKSKKTQTPKHPVRPGRDINPERLYRSRKAPITLTVEDSTAITQIDRQTVKADGLIISLASRIPKSCDIRTVQIRERDSSIRRGRNRPLRDRSYRINLIIQVGGPEEKVPWTNPAGLDAGVVHNLTDSEGNHFDQPKEELAPSLNRTEELANRQKRLKRGGRQWTKLQKLIRKEKKHLTNAKDNWEHHTAKRIATEASFVVVEDLNHKGMRGSARGTPENPGRNVRAKAGLNRSLALARPGAMQRKLARQCEKNGTWFTKAPPSGHQPDLSPLRVQTPGKPQEPSGIPVPQLRARGQRRLYRRPQYAKPRYDGADPYAPALGPRPGPAGPNNPPAGGNTAVRRQPDHPLRTARPQAGPIQGEKTGGVLPRGLAQAVQTQAEHLIPVNSRVNR